MSLLKKSLIISAILAAYIVVVAFAVDVNTGNNVCDISKKTLFNGTQNPNGECVTTVMGEIPSKDKMVSTVIRFPKDGDTVQENQPFTIVTKTINLATGFFDDPATQYYSFPQTLDDQGLIQGHSHVTVQQVVDENEPFDPQVFAFFKGLNDPANGQGELSVLVDKGLPAGKYRVCTMVAAFAHQPTLMPIAQRGAQDDCTRFTVVQQNNKRSLLSKLLRRK
jgi:transcription initiation factor TFIID subunit 15